MPLLALIGFEGQSGVLAQTDSLSLKYPVYDTPSHGETYPASPIDLEEPDNAGYSAMYDALSGTVTIYRKIGGMNVRLPYTMTLEEYQNDRTRRSMLEYWLQRSNEDSKAKRDATSEGGEGGADESNSILNSKWRINSDLFASIFGSNQITMKLQGQAKVSLGVQINKIDNPTMQERMRKSTSFDFNQSVQMNLNSQIGERMKLAINYNTEATFDFENEVKLDYTGTEDDIIQDIEAGNITWTLPGTLIQGSQSLFGLKMDMKFGKLKVSTVFSQKKGETQSMTIQGGATKKEFDIDITNYERNRHFFLAHYFKDMYDNALRSLPTINSPIIINKIEVWVTNRTGSYNNTRNILAFTDIAENDSRDLQAPDQWRTTNKAVPSNEANDLYSQLTTSIIPSRSINEFTSIMSSFSNLRSARDYEKMENARMLSSSEYTLNERLGYISLSQPLNNNEVLAVAFQYTYRGQTYKVGELTTDGVDAPQCLVLKMLKGTTFTPKYVAWDLMMKNIYNLGSYDIEQKDFDLNIVYCSDSTSNYVNYLSEGERPMNGGHNGETFLQIMGFDRLNSSNDVTPDGKYDFVSGITVDASKGRVIFPVREPFGEAMAKKIGDKRIGDKYAFTALYDSTQVFAKQQTSKNKFRLRGSYSSSSSADISLNAFNIAKGSVTVTAGGQTLTENVDYSVDYQLGRVRILNQSILNSGQAINVQYENESAITTQTQTMVGAHLDYEISDDWNIGATIIHMKERPLTNKVAYGDESLSNTMLGFNTEFKRNLPFITSALDALPMLSTKEMSTITVEAEVARLIAGHTKTINAAYIDDFEGYSISYDIKNWTSWHLASKPQGQPDLLKNADLTNNLSQGFDRAKLAWYTIDPLFLRNMTTTPRHIRNDKEQQSSHYVREVYEEELYPNKESAYGESTNISVLNLAYYPNERGSYNFSTDLDKNGHLTDPESNWAGIQRKLDQTDFESANIEYIQFWMLDPFIYNADKPNVGGELYFNIGNISEDVLKDSRKSFEHGMPAPNELPDIDSTAWGYVPKNNSLVNAFNTDPASMRAQDVGLNGMTSEKERTFYNSSDYPFISMIQEMHSKGALTDEAYNEIMADPAADDYHYYRGGDYDSQQMSILDRYKKFNNTEGNSCPSEYSPESYSTAAWSRPDNEDMNGDYTLSETENYYQYHVSIHPDSMVVGKNHIADMMETAVKLRNGKTERVHWYQFKIPISNPEKVVGDITDMSSMQFIRMFVTGFADTCIMRFATLDLVKSEWRKFTDHLYETPSNPVTQTQFITSTVNIEENDRRVPVNYVLPPGIDRTVDPSNPQLRQLNEQAYSLKVVDLGNADARAVYKVLNMDLRQYRRLKMFVHAEAIDGYPLENNQMSLFIRLGSDYVDNYYEYEIPLSLTPHGSYQSSNESDRYAVWPEENELNIPLELFTKCKLSRNEAKKTKNITLQDVYSIADPQKVNNKVRIKGNPSLGNVVTMMLGVRAHGAGLKSAEVWVNELRLTEFNEDGGWAARGRSTIKLADLGSVSASGQYASVGFGSINQSVQERLMEEQAQFDITSNLELGKLLGQKSRLSIPFYVGYSKKVATPEYSPYDSDVKLRTAIDAVDTKAERDSIKKVSQTVETTRSINVTNMRLKPATGAGAKKPTIISPTNFSATYAYNETKKSDPETEYDLSKDINAQLAYNYSTSAKPIEPFKKTKLDPKKFGLLKELSFYPQPSLLAYRLTFDRDYQEVQKRNVNNPEYVVPISFSQDMSMNRFFDFKYNLTKNLRFSLNTNTSARVDEPAVPVNKDKFAEEYKHWRDSTMHNVLRFGRTTDYQHNADLNWTVPINKLPYLDFLSATAQYKAVYNWKAEQLGTVYEWGNIISNRQTEQLSGMFNLQTLYQKSNKLKDIYQKYNFSSSNRQTNKQAGSRTERYVENNVAIEKGKPVTIKHNLGTTDITVRVFDANGRAVKGTLTPVDEKTAKYTCNTNVPKARIVLVGTVTDKTSPAQVVKDVALQLLTIVKSVSVSYSENNSTTLHGYMPGVHFAGMETYNGKRAPGFAFIAGVQDRDFAKKAVNNGWLTTDTTLNEPYTMTHNANLQVRASLELFKALKIELSAQRSHDKHLSEYYVFNSAGFDGVYNTLEGGTYSMSINAFGTSFKTPNKTGELSGPLYDEFIARRSNIASRYQDESRRLGAMAATSGSETVVAGVDGFGETSQQVLVPSFVSAYMGMNANDVWLDIIPSAKFLRPNWRVTFSGLNNIKSLQPYIRNLELSHSYTGKFSVGQYQTNLDWDGRGGVSLVRDLQGNYVPEYSVTTVTISEQLNPFIQLSATFVNNMTTSFAINKQRTLALSLANNQITETYSKDWNLSLGYRFDNLPIFIGKDEEAKKFNNSLNLTFTLSQRDSYTILRRIEEMNSELASGTKSTNIKFSADYAFTRRFNMEFYYDQSIAKPYVSTGYPTSNTNVGISFQLSLSE